MVMLPIPFDKLLCFTVVDVTSNLTTAQRVVPVNRLKSGYRHLRLHNEMDQPLPLSQLFLCRYVVIACAHGQFLHNFQDLLIQTQKRTTLATIKVLLILSKMLQNYPFQCQISLIKVGVLLKYSPQKFFFGKIRSILDTEK